MRLVCAREHFSGSAGYYNPPSVRVCESLGEFLFCWLSHHQTLWQWLARKGFVDALREGDVAFWRWDYWNANMARQIREYEQREWEAKRRAAIRRWGDSA